jgi:hypothetical protein
MYFLEILLDDTKTSSDPYQGQNGSIIIGTSNISLNTYHGLIDDFKYTAMAKLAADILNDAALIAYFSFDSSPLIDDMGPNKLSGFMQNDALINGKVGQALSLSRTSSVFEAYAFYQLSLSNGDFSFVLRINLT